MKTVVGGAKEPVDVGGGFARRPSLPAVQPSWIAGFLLATLAIGLLLRWQLAGRNLIPLLSQLDLRRAHSHLGFYGVLFPISWCMLARHLPWVPGKRALIIYFSVTVASIAGFLAGGYGPLARASSSIVLAVWLWFAWKNRASVKALFARSWLACLPIAIVTSAALIVAVAFASKQSPTLANQLARAFLTVLLFDAFVPAALNLVGRARIPAIVWLAASFASAAFLTGLVSHAAMGAGLCVLGLAILASLGRAERTGGLELQWATFAVSLLLTGTGVLPYGPASAIAGIHFLVLGPLLSTYALRSLHFRAGRFVERLYCAAVVTMSAAIAAPGLVSIGQPHLPTVAAISGTIVVATIALAIGLGVWRRERRFLRRSLIPC